MAWGATERNGGHFKPRDGAQGKGREESPTSHVIYEIVSQPMTGEQMATTSCSSSFVYYDCLIFSLPKRGDYFFWNLLTDVDIISFHGNLKNWPNIWDRT